MGRGERGGLLRHPSVKRLAVAVAVTVGVGLVTNSSRAAALRARLRQQQGLPLTPWGQLLLLAFNRAWARAPPLGAEALQQCHTANGGVLMHKLRALVLAGGIAPELRAQVWLLLLGVEDPEQSLETREAKRLERQFEYYELQHRRRVNLEREREAGEQERREEDSAWLNQLQAQTAWLTTAAAAASTSHSRTTSSVLPEVASPAAAADEAATAPSSSRLSADGAESTSAAHPDAPSSSVGRHESSDSLLGAEQMESFNESRSRILLDTPRTSMPSEDTNPRQFRCEVVFRHHKRRFHSRLAEILETWVLLDTDIGYCQGMNELASPFLHYYPGNAECFWAFRGMMDKFGRRNFLLDGSGITMQLQALEKLLKRADRVLYDHLLLTDAAHCHILFRALLVLLRREYPFESVMLMWDVLFAHEDPNFIVYVAYAIISSSRAELLRCRTQDEAFELLVQPGRRTDVDVWTLLDIAMKVHMEVTCCGPLVTR